ncbi:hypothetical protein V492_00940 [Pseudogymnoascus sp. VKM F-4246]|nr:hypothetical protein V492_00940 [Pseudogymnoascus sp. VKM F-4246]
MSFYSIEADIVAFACNRNPNSGSVILPDGYREEIGRITGTCGRYIAGATQLGDDGSALILRYAWWKKGDDFCADATSSPPSSC